MLFLIRVNHARNGIIIDEAINNADHESVSLSLLYESSSLIFLTKIKIIVVTISIKNEIIKPFAIIIAGN